MDDCIDAFLASREGLILNATNLLHLSSKQNAGKGQAWFVLQFKAVSHVISQLAVRPPTS